MRYTYKCTVLNGNFYIVLGECIATSAYESNTKAILSSYIRKCITFGWPTRAYRRASGVFRFFPSPLHLTNIKL